MTDRHSVVAPDGGNAPSLGSGGQRLVGVARPAGWPVPQGGSSRRVAHPTGSPIPQGGLSRRLPQSGHLTSLSGLPAAAATPGVPDSWTRRASLPRSPRHLLLWPPCVLAPHEDTGRVGRAPRLQARVVSSPDERACKTSLSKRGGLTSGETLLSQRPPELRVRPRARAGTPDRSRPLAVRRSLGASRPDPSSAPAPPARPPASRSVVSPQATGTHCLPRPVEHVGRPPGLSQGAPQTLGPRPAGSRWPPAPADAEVSESCLLDPLQGRRRSARGLAPRPRRPAPPRTGPPGLSRPPCLGSHPVSVGSGHLEPGFFLSLLSTLLGQPWLPVCQEPPLSLQRPPARCASPSPARGRPAGFPSPPGNPLSAATEPAQDGAARSRPALVAGARPRQRQALQKHSPRE